VPLSLFKKIKKRHLLVAALLAFGFAVWNIDFAIGVLDTAILVMVTLGAILVSLFSATLSLILKRTEKAVFSLLICFAVVIGTVVGNTIIHQQLKDAQTHVESISKTIHRLHTQKGSFPESLPKLKSFSSPVTVPLGIFNKRHLHYEVWNDSSRFRLWFPYKAFLIASYDGLSKEWSIKD
jgi:predicted PurR-regulated permease PerM